jgi:hypothetical protein
MDDSAARSKAAARFSRGTRIEFVGTTFDGAIEREIEVGGVLIAPGLIDPDALVALIRPCRVSTIKRITSAFQSFA